MLRGWRPGLLRKAERKEDLSQGRLLVVRTVAASLLVLSSSLANAAVHTVRSGDTLWQISRKYGVSVSALANANGMSENATLPLGKKLTIPGSASSSGSSKSASASWTGNVGTVLRAAPLRAEPSTKAKIMGTLPAGAKVKVLGTKWHWHHVKTASGSLGWVGDYLVRVTSVSPKPTSSAKSKSPASASAARTSGYSSAVQTAMSNLGARYRYGGTSRGGFDCSGFTRYVYAKHGVSLPHNSAAQFSKGTPVSKSNLSPGDLVFFSRGGSRIGHVGVYIGNGKFVHASNPRGGVRVDSLNSGSYSRNYVGARRVK